MAFKSKKLIRANRTKNSIAKTKAKADAYLTKSKGKAIRQQAKKHETELTKRTAFRSAALSNAVTQNAKYRAQAQQASNQWNSIINGPTEGYEPNKGTSDQSGVDSTTNPERVS